MLSPYRLVEICFSLHFFSLVRSASVPNCTKRAPAAAAARYGHTDVEWLGVEKEGLLQRHVKLWRSKDAASSPVLGLSAVPPTEAEAAPARTQRSMLQIHPAIKQQQKVPLGQEHEKKNDATKPVMNDVSQQPSAHVLLETRRRVGGGMVVQEPADIPEMTWQCWTVSIVLMGAFMLLYLEPFPQSIVMLLALCVVWCLGIITTQQAIRGFSNEAVVIVAALFVVVKGVDRARFIDSMARFCLGTYTSESAATFRIVVLCIVLGCFINNTPLVALLMNIVDDWAQKRNYATSKFLMPIAFGSMIGGHLALTGISTNLILNGMLGEATGESFGIFDPAIAGLPVSLFALAYLHIVGIHFLPDHRKDALTEAERTAKVVTQLRVSGRSSLIAENLTEALDKMLGGMVAKPREALLKIFRLSPAVQTRLKGRSRSAWVPRQSVSDSRRLGPAVSGSSSATSAGFQRTSGSVSATSAEFLRMASVGHGASEARQDSLNLGPRARSATEGLLLGAAGRGSGRSSVLLQDDMDFGIQELIPVPEGEVVRGGDILVLGLPQQKCLEALETAGFSVVRTTRRLGVLGDSDDSDLDLVLEGPHSETDRPSADEEEEAPEEARPKGLPDRSLQVFNADMIDLAGSKNVLVELVLSNMNPFCGKRLDGPRLKYFEELYEVSVLSVRPVGEEADPVAVPRGMRTLSSRLARLWPGDTLRVLAPKGEGLKKLSDLAQRDFLAVTVVGGADAAPVRWTDYIPLALFIAGMIAVVANQMSMVKVSVLLLVLYVMGQWIEAGRISEHIDLHILILIGSALGLAEAVKSSGLAQVTARCVVAMGLGPRGTMSAMFLFTMVISETVTSAAAAAVAFPLALKLAEVLELVSPKPLVMTVMLGAATSFANPIAQTCCLIVMSRGRYTLGDFLRVGLVMDLIFWVGYSIVLPSAWPM